MRFVAVKTIEQQVVLAQMQQRPRGLDEDIAQTERAIAQWHRSNEASQRLAEIPGLGYLTASATVATVGDARPWRNARQLAAALGFAVPGCGRLRPAQELLRTQPPKPPLREEGVHVSRPVRLGANTHAPARLYDQDELRRCCAGKQLGMDSSRCDRPPDGAACGETSRPARHS